eukprot:TRINITY_DN9933_c0_g1_i1.p1 TRINITY_DN9933_c0_g1~~TRINITY_DN9933_c0_g1_i1.p1  ORF type:complete len:432 (-),score=118.69 TRINITY_DN9933_c0_g1_i1:931-2226(-)
MQQSHPLTRTTSMSSVGTQSATAPPPLVTSSHLALSGSNPSSAAGTAFGFSTLGTPLTSASGTPTIPSTSLYPSSSATWDAIDTAIRVLIDQQLIELPKAAGQLDAPGRIEGAIGQLVQAVALRDHALMAALRELRLASVGEKTTRLAALSREDFASTGSQGSGVSSTTSSTPSAQVKMLEEVMARAVNAASSHGVTPRALDQWRIVFLNLSRVVTNPSVLPSGVLPPPAAVTANLADKRIEQLQITLGELTAGLAERDAAIHRLSSELAVSRSNARDSADAEGLRVACSALQGECSTLRKQHELDANRIATLERQVVHLTLDLDRADAQLGIAESEKAALVAAKRSLHSVNGTLERRLHAMQDSPPSNASSRKWIPPSPKELQSMAASVAARQAALAQYEADAAAVRSSYEEHSRAAVQSTEVLKEPSES